MLDSTSIGRHPLAALAALMLVAALALALVFGLRARIGLTAQGALQSIAITPDPPPPQSPPKPPEPAKAKPGGSISAAPRPAPPLPHLTLAPPTIPAAPAPALGAALSGTGGPGTGGSGSGAGSGAGSGNGPGDGNGPATPAEQISGRLSPRDLPPGTIPPGGQLSVGVAYTVGTDGRVHDCATPRSSGDAAIDARVCDLLARRYRYRPAQAADGTPVASTVRETHSWARRPGR